MAVLIYERAIHVDEETGELRSYWPEYWPLERLAERWRILGSGAFAASYQNDPTALQGNALERDWLTFYLPDELEAAREAAGVERGQIIAGVDPARGGTGRHADYFAAVLGELIDNTLFLIDNFNRRLPIEHQAQFLEDWLTARGGILYGVIEDTSARGYVWNDLQNVNGGAGSRYNWIIEKVQGRGAVGSKEMRFLAMAPRFKSGQVRIPGRRLNSGQLDPAPAWETFVQQWCAFPGGHDDLLDAAYWCQYAAFAKAQPPAAAQGAPRPGLCPHNRPEASCYDCNSVSGRRMRFGIFRR